LAYFTVLGGKNKYRQGNTNPDDLSFIEDVTTITNASYNSIELLPGHTFFFKKNYYFITKSF